MGNNNNKYNNNSNKYQERQETHSSDTAIVIENEKVDAAAKTADGGIQPEIITEAIGSKVEEQKATEAPKDVTPRIVKGTVNKGDRAHTSVKALYATMENKKNYNINSSLVVAITKKSGQHIETAYTIGSLVDYICKNKNQINKLKFKTKESAISFLGLIKDTKSTHKIKSITPLQKQYVYECVAKSNEVV